eukprot:5445149-Karenia_brevis.AAC.1
MSMCWVDSLAVKKRVANIFSFWLASPTSSSECSQALLKPLVASPLWGLLCHSSSYGKAKPGAKYGEDPP